MNKILLLALLGFALIPISGAEEEKGQALKEVQHIEIREVREAGRNNKNAKSRKSRKQKRNKKTKQSKKRVGKKASRRKSVQKKPQNVKSQARASTCLEISCIDTAVGYMKLLKDKVANFGKQNARIMKQNKTGNSKSGKKGIFGPVVRRIVENGGGNASNLTCNGKSNNGASQLTNLTETLLNCEDEIKVNCDPSNLPQPNMTKVTACNTAIDAFKTKAGECLKASGSAACTCWSDNTLTAAAKTIKSCDLSQDSKLFAKALKKCTSTFGKCRKYEDEVGTALHACNQNTDILVKKLTNLKQNEAALQTLKTKLNSTTSRDASTRTITCTELATITTTIISLVAQNPSSYSIFSLIQKVSVVTFSCTPTEKEVLKAMTAKVDDAITIVTEEVTHIQTSLILLTGSAASDADISAAGVCQTEQECDSVVSLDSSSPSTTTSGESTISMTPLGESPVSMSSMGEEPVSMTPLGESPVSMTPSGESPVSMTQMDESSVTMTSLGNTPEAVMTTQRASRFLQYMMRKRMVQILV